MPGKLGKGAKSERNDLMTSKKTTSKTKLSFSQDKVFQVMFENHTAVMLLTEPQTGEILEANQAAVNFYGYPQLRGMSVNDINPLLPEQVEAAAEKQNFLVCPHKLASGEFRTVEVYTSAIDLEEKQFHLSTIHDITEQKRAEQQSHDADERFARAFRSSPIGINIFKLADGCSVDANNTFLNTIGYSREELLGHTAAELNLFVEPEEHAAWMKTLRAEGAVTGIETTLRTKSGEIRHVLFSMVIFEMHGEMVGMMLNVDITKRKHAEQELQESKSALQAVLQSTTDGILAVDSESKVLFTNERFAEMWRIPSSVIAGKDDKVILQYILDQLIDPQEFLQKVQDLYNSAEECFDAINFNDGRIFERLSRPLIREEKPCGRVWSFRDITERKHAEQALRASEDRYHSLFENSITGIFITKPDGTVLAANPEACRLVGWAEEEICRLGRNGVINLADPRLPAALAERAQTGQFRGELTFIRADGTIFPTDLVSTIFPDSTGELRSSIFFQDITDRKAAEEALKESEANLAGVFNATDDAIILLAADKTLLALNEVAVQRMGQPREELVGRKVFELFPPEVSEHRHPYIERAFSTGEVVIFEDKRNGRILHNHLYPILDSDGKVIRLAIYSRDVTDSKLMEQALRESEEKYRTIANFTYDWESWRAPDGPYLYISPSCKRISGYTVAEFMDDQNLMIKITHPDDRSMVNEHFYTMTHHSKEQHNHLDFRIVTPDGETRWISHHCTPVFGDGGVWLGRRESNRDITVRKVAEDALKKSEEKFRALAENIPSVVFQCRNDSRYTFLYLNNPVENLTGYSKEEFLENGLSFLDICHPDDLPAMSTLRTPDNPNINQGPFHITYRIQHKSGEWRWVDEWGIGITNAAGEEESLEGIMVDITERKRIEQELKAQHDFATQIINMMGQGLTVTNAKGQFEFVNPAYARLFGYEPADLIGRHPRDITILEDQGILIEQRKHRQAGRTSTYESRLRRADGSIAQVLITGVPRERDGKYAGAIAVITDLTEQKRIEDELRQAKDLLEKALIREQKLSHTDALTGINNRRHLFELAQRKFAVASRYKQPLTVILFDIDHFKNINDLYGHDMGDQMLIRVTKIVFSELRSADVIGRYGGEEFIVLLPMTNAQQAYLLAERIRTSVASLCVPSEKGEISVTLSIGIAEINHVPQSENVEDVFHRADEAMYCAKQAGRNRTAIYDTK